MRKSWALSYQGSNAYQGGYIDSGNKKQFDLMGRFDWSWDGVNPPKLLEYNADTPSLLLESSAISRDWLKTSTFKNER